MGKKKFFDKKKSATFQLLSRDSSDPIYVEEPENDRVFVRVDNNRVKINGLDEDNDDEDYSNDPESIYADAPEDGGYQGFRSSGTFPDHVRREILELGFPDDGYNYLNHLREIRNTGGGSAYYENPKAELHQLPNDVKAYDASRVRIKEASEITSPKTLYNVAEKTVTVKVQKAVDPEIANLLEDNESEFGSDIDELEEDFVVLANHSAEIGDVYEEESLSSISNPHAEVQTGVAYSSIAEVVRSVNEDNRPQRLLDQQFDILEQQEYGSDSDDDYKNYVAEEEDISLAEKLNSVLKDRVDDDLEFDGNYTAPAEILRRCAEYAEKYENEDGNDKEVVIVEESSDESEIWDCETIVSTYSNLDNHPGRIGAPGRNRKKILAETFSGALKSGSDKIITLGGKAKLPVDYLPHGKKEPKETAKVVAKPEVPKRKPHGQETKEEKKERKAAVKEEKREARRLKKDLKELYRDEAKLAQKVAAVTGPSSIHLM